MDGSLPGLREDLDFIPLEADGRRVVAVRDHLGLAPQDRAFLLDVLRLYASLGEAATLDDLAAALGRATGDGSVGLDEARDLVAGLDDCRLLDSPAFRADRAAAIEAWDRAAVRPAILAGRSYPAGEGELAAWLDTVLACAGAAAGPGPVRALVAPHLEPAAAARVYANAYAALRGAAPRRVVVLGVGHSLYPGLVSLTTKDYATPLGRVSTDADAVRRLAGAAGKAAAGHDLDHRAEHSVELQVAFLQRVLPAGSFGLVPVLLGAAAALPELSRAAFRRAAGPFLDELAALLAEPDALAVAGVDLCHIGPKFGHDRTARDLEREALAHDAALLEAAAAGDADGFWAEGSRVGDRYHVCGFLALAALLEALPGARGRVLDHLLWHEEPTRSAVSCAGLAYPADRG
ncbi:MAG: AmmeMemoRadiSam system protein B [Thermodesulfobacteriota bacterium]